MKSRDTIDTHSSSVPRAWPSRLVILAAAALLGSVGPAWADAEGHSANRAPDLPAPACNNVEVPAGNRVSLHAYALGVQIYHWDGTKWVFVAPEAALFADSCYDEQIGIHYVGPTWEANDHSTVVGARLAGCTPNRGAIPWLKLGGTSPSRHGKFAGVTCIRLPSLLISWIATMRSASR